METETAATPDTSPKTSRWEDYIDVFFSPVELFRRRAQDRVAPPFLTLIGLALLFYFLLMPANRIAMRASITDPQQLEAMERMGALFTIFGAISIPIMYGLLTVVAAFLLWLMGRMVDIRTDFSRTMLIATYSGFIMLLAQIAGGVLILVMGDTNFDAMRSMSFGPLRFLGSDDMNPFVTALIGRFDLFALWQALIWGIGMAVIYRAGTAKAVIVAGVTWFLFLVPQLLQAVAAAAQRG